MSGFCRICYEKSGHDQDCYVSCNNCGSFACRIHHEWWGRSKNAFCTECFPSELANNIADAANGLNATSRPATETGKQLRELIQGMVHHYLGSIPLDHLVRLLFAISEEIKRRDVQNDMDIA